ncbi:cytochrome P450 [Cyathus striatus]|nr:cytochrome P450 [Cyathus striatus]
MHCLLYTAPFLALVLYRLTLYLRTSHLPPGPISWPFNDVRRRISNYPWKTFHNWQMQYGDVISFRLGKTSVIVLGSLKAAVDLLEKRSSIYSSRPRSIVAAEILSGGMRGVSMDYGQRWKNWRSLIHAAMSVEASQGYKPIQCAESGILMKDLLHEKDIKNYATHFRRFAVSVVFCIGYGRRVESLKEEIVIESQRIDEYFSKVNVPGRYLVDSWPFLLRLPKRLQWFRHEAEQQRERDTQMYLKLLAEVKQRINLGMAQHSMATKAFQKQAEFGLNEIETAYALSAPFAAGVATTLASFEIFTLAMLLYPSVMHKIQAELDEVVGRERLPSFEDRKRLPYIESVIKETVRWKPIAPLGIPHKVTADDAYEGMYIPKGSTIYANLYSITQDDEMFPDPNTFNPERFLNNNDPRFVNYTLSFGFGRRFCPGMHIAYQSLFILVSRVLWAFDIVPITDNSGKPKIPSPDNLTSGLVARPKELQYHLICRHDNCDSVILSEAEVAELEAKSWS